jgi:hypothetical protein
MAQTGFTPISLYNSPTASTVPSAGNLVAGELAINTLDEKIYFKNLGGVVKQIASSLSTANTFTGTQTFSGSTATFGTSLLDSNETVNVVAAAPAATTNYYLQSGAVQLYTTNAANNWILNIAFSAGTSMNTALAIGQSATLALVTTQGATAYYNTSVTIDGVAVTPKWIGGAPAAGNASGLDAYRFSVIKTASATYTVLASLVQYK